MANGPNPAMRSKRVHGPSAHTIMHTHIRMERCNVAGCKNEVIATRNPNGLTKIRACIEHVGTGGKPKIGGNKVTDLLLLPWQR